VVVVLEILVKIQVTLGQIQFLVQSHLLVAVKVQEIRMLVLLQVKEDQVALVVEVIKEINLVLVIHLL
tara:strand:+ start:34 stop:237 length:204 start_codon:yes stop_codon:yes gene_type:complete